MAQIPKLVADSAENIKRSNVEAAGEQLKEIKRLCREEPKSFKRKGNGKSHLEINRSLVGGPSGSMPSMILVTARRTARRFAEQKRELRRL